MTTGIDSVLFELATARPLIAAEAYGKALLGVDTFVRPLV